MQEPQSGSDSRTLEYVEIDTVAGKVSSRPICLNPLWPFPGPAEPDADKNRLEALYLSGLPLTAFGPVPWRTRLAYRFRSVRDAFVRQWRRLPIRLRGPVALAWSGRLQDQDTHRLYWAMRRRPDCEFYRISEDGTDGIEIVATARPRS